VSPALALDGAGWRFDEGHAIGPVDLRVEPGERVLLAGRSGAGKSTLLRRAAALHGWGQPLGTVRVLGDDPLGWSPRDRPARLAFVSQEPADQIVCGTVREEIAFGPVNSGWPDDRVAAIVPHVLDVVGLDVDPERDPRALSGGEQQRLAVAAAVAAGARVLLLDEPLAQLDPEGATALLSALERLSADGVAVLLAEHRLERCLPWATRVVVLSGGALGDSDELERMRAPVRRAWPVDPEPGDLVCAIQDLVVRRGDRVLLPTVSLAIRRGERIAVLGRNGAGKSTLLGTLSGRLGGAPIVPGVIEVPQDPDLTLFAATVRAEIAYGPRDRRTPADVPAVAAALGLAHLHDRAPQGLSRGERLRVAVAAALACRPPLLLLDEPTAGQDPDSVEAVAAALRTTMSDGAVLFATHDERFAERHATRVMRIEDGELRSDR
jgi:energy-coupling factor transport system ATP-binding protein